jgi:tRNA (guanine37-N1)-methyltransferase
MVVVDAITRQLPGALGDADSAKQDSFVDGLLDCPHYTRPEAVSGINVPDVLLSGDHVAIARWRRKQALGRTWTRRSDLLEKIELTADDSMLLNEFIREIKIL